MNKLTFTITLLVSTLVFSTSASAEGSLQHFGDSAQHLKQSTQHTAGSFGHTVVGSSKLVSGVLAVPFKAIGKVGDVGEAVGEVLWENANGEQPLEVTEHTVSAGPEPTVAINL